MTTHYIYSIKNIINNKRYIGQTVNIKKRKSYHFWSLNNNRHFNSKLQNDFNKYGFDNFEFKILLIVTKKSDSNYHEKKLVDLWDTINNGYNVYEGGRFEYRKSFEKFGKYVTWNNKDYKSIRACARALGIDKKSLEYRLSKGYSKDDDLKHGEMTKRPVVWNNIKYESLSKASKENGIHSSTMSERLSKGYTCDLDMVGSGHAKRN